MMQGINEFIKTDHMRATSTLMITILCYSLLFIYNIDNPIMDNITIFEKTLIFVLLYCSVWFVLSCLKIHLNYQSKMKRINEFWNLLETSMITIKKTISDKNIVIHRQCFKEANQPLYYLWLDKRLLELIELNTLELTVDKVNKWIEKLKKIIYDINYDFKSSQINKEEEALYLEILNSLSLISEAPNLKKNMIEEWNKYGRLEKQI